MVNYIMYKKMFFFKIKQKENIIYISKINKNIAKKVVKKLIKQRIKDVACDKNIMNNNEFINYLYANELNVFNGRKLFKKIIKNILNYIENNGINIKTKSAAILVNDNSNFNKNIINDISEEFKQITIVTNNINKFVKIEKQLEEKGVPINISNNKKKCLNKKDFIINIDFPEELINKYKINSKAIIINIEESIKIKSKKFSGININYYKLDIEDKYTQYEYFDKNIIYESIDFYKKENRYENLKIKYLIGNNGEIGKQEFNKLCSIS